MPKVDSEGSAHFDEVTARAANRVSGLHVAVGKVKVLTDGDIGAYCDKFNKEHAANRLAIASQIQQQARSVLDADTTRDK